MLNCFLSYRKSILWPIWEHFSRATCKEIRKFKRNIRQLTTPSFRVDLLRTVCRSFQCLNAEKIAPFVSIFSLPRQLRHRGEKVKPLWRVCGIAHCTWPSFDRKYESKPMVGRLSDLKESQSCLFARHSFIFLLLLSYPYFFSFTWLGGCLKWELKYGRFDSNYWDSFHKSRHII